MKTAAVTKKSLEKKYDVKLVGPKWVLSGAGPARYGYANVEPCRETFMGRTLTDVAARLAQ